MSANKISQNPLDRRKFMQFLSLIGTASLTRSKKVFSSPQSLAKSQVVVVEDDSATSGNSIDENVGILWPELGSRAFINSSSGKTSAYGEWRVIQDGRYRYAIGQSSGDWVKFVLSEYLACRVVW